MSVSLYRKYRPQTFADVVGQEHVEKTLVNAVRSGKLSHAYLFCGPRGTGKTTMARLLAKALLCVTGPAAEPDGTCEQCREVAEGVHPDVHELDAASRTGVENIREEIISRVKFAPTRGAYKIYIIDEVHMLSQAAFNALLLTLEEPPPHIVFILCTTDAHKVPPTILSRVQRFDFKHLSEAQITSRLTYISEKEGFIAEPSALELIAVRSRGGLRDAIGSLEQVAVFGGGTVSFAAVEDLLGEVTSSQLFSLADLVADRDAGGCFAWVSDFAQSATDIALFINEFAGHMRNLYAITLIESTTTLENIVGADRERQERYREQAQRFASVDRLAHILSILGDLSIELKSAPNARLAMEIALTRMVRPASDLTLESLAARIAVLEQGALLTQQGVVSQVPVAQVQDKAQDVKCDAPRALEREAPVPTQDQNIPALAPDTSDVSKQDASASELNENKQEIPTSVPDGASPVEADAAGAHRLWLQVQQEVKKESKIIGSLLSGSEVRLDEKNEALTILLPGDATFAKKKLEEPASAEMVSKNVTVAFGRAHRLTYRLGNTNEQQTSMRPGSRQEPVYVQERDPSSGIQEPTKCGSECERQEEQAKKGSKQEQDKTVLEEMLSSSIGSTISIEEL